MTMVTLDLTGTCPCGRSLRGVQVADATVRIRSLRLSAGLVGFQWCPDADRNHPAGHGNPTDVRGTLTVQSAETVAATRQALRERNARRRRAGAV